jgi:hypothetical protein
MVLTIEGNSHKTAMSRNKPSAPMVRLKGSGRLVGNMLDYGCGKGYDASHFGMDSYDPYYQPVMPLGTFDTITCNFVLNVIESPEAREAVIADIRSRLSRDGRAYITVRTDKKRLNGYTSTGSWQGLIVLDMPIVSRGSGFVTYCTGKE